MKNLFLDKAGEKYEKTQKIVSFKKTFWVFVGVDKKYLKRVVQESRIKEVMTPL